VELVGAVIEVVDEAGRSALHALADQPWPSELGRRPAVALAVHGPPVPAAVLERLGAVQLLVDHLGASASHAAMVAAAASLIGTHPRDVVVLAASGSPLLDAAAATGAHSAVGTPTDLARRCTELAAVDQAEVGLGPHPEPWPEDPRLDPALLAAGDRRNVVDRYRYWREDAIVAELDACRTPVHVAVENWRHDLNIGTVVRNANAFNVAGVHIVGKRRWNRRGAMATDRYLHVHHHATVADLMVWATTEGLELVGIDNRPGAVPIERVDLPDAAVLVLGQEGPGLSEEMAAACSMVCEITQFGSTRSLNAGVASGIALHVWLGQRWPRSGPVL
jgi:tRNA(Leu) C34 or U34 (ribose-2'-O)-methylase TrmL